jgi:hypothetical protein
MLMNRQCFYVPDKIGVVNAHRSMERESEMSTMTRQRRVTAGISGVMAVVGVRLGFFWYGRLWLGVYFKFPKKFQNFLVSYWIVPEGYGVGLEVDPT